jgi:hypothetical protein
VVTLDYFEHLSRDHHTAPLGPFQPVAHHYKAPPEIRACRSDPPDRGVARSKRLRNFEVPVIQIRLPLASPGRAIPGVDGPLPATVLGAEQL